MKLNLCSLFVAGLLAASVSHAAIVIDTVLVADAGNANDTTNFGGVSYNYHIGTHHVTNEQYTAFLNATAQVSDPQGLWNSNMGSNEHGGINRSGSEGNWTYSVRTPGSGINAGQNMANRPVNFVSFWDAARFTNWLTTGDTETGVYNLNGVTNPENNTIARDEDAWLAGGVAIASENEWYKAAYYDPTLSFGDGGYWLYTTQSNDAPTATGPNGTDANSANYNNDVGTVTDAGAYTLARSYYGTYDQGGNLQEWNDRIIASAYRGLRGGSFESNDTSLWSSNWTFQDPADGFATVGFRVSSLEPIPEPSTYTAIFGLLTIGFVLWRRKRHGSL